MAMGVSVTERAAARIKELVSTENRDGQGLRVKVVGGRRMPIAPVGTPAGTYGSKAKVASGAWHTLRVEFQGAEAAVLYDGNRLFTVRDDTFREAGKIGVWSKADSTTEFETPQFGDKP